MLSLFRQSRWSIRVAMTFVVTALVVLSGATPAQAALSDKRNDLNGDGISDIVVMDWPPSLDCAYRYLGNGSGSFDFGSPQSLGCGWGFYRPWVSPGDLNGDGRGDLVAVNIFTGCLWRWYSTSSGVGAGQQLGCGWGIYSVLAGAGDLNNDGRGDLLGVNQSTGCIWRWFGTSSGSFGTGLQLGCGWDPYTALTGVGDLNRDGNADIVGVNRSNYCLYRWYGNGSGGLGAGNQVGCGWDDFYFYSDLSGLGDLNGNGIGDLVAIANSDSCLWRWSGNGNGGFNAGVRLACNWLGYYIFT